MYKTLINFNDDNFADHDLRMRPPKSVILVAGETGVSILIGTKNDNKLENNETLEISAFTPSDNDHKCETNVIIVDDSKLYESFIKILTLLKLVYKLHVWFHMLRLLTFDSLQ